MSANHTSPSTESTYVQAQKNFSLLVADIGWFGLALPATSQFLAIYAIRLDASAALLGWLAALPSIVALISSTFAQWWRKRYPEASDTDLRRFLAEILLGHDLAHCVCDEGTSAA